MDANQLLIEIGKRVYWRRKHLGLTQEQVAEAMGVSLQMISNLELGKKAIRPDNLVKLCNVLGTSADYILTGNFYGVDSDGLVKSINALTPRELEAVTLLVERLAQN